MEENSSALFLTVFVILTPMHWGKNLNSAFCLLTSGS